MLSFRPSSKVSRKYRACVHKESLIIKLRCKIPSKQMRAPKHRVLEDQKLAAEKFKYSSLRDVIHASSLKVHPGKGLQPSCKKQMESLNGDLRGDAEVENGGKASWPSVSQV